MSRMKPHPNWYDTRWAQETENLRWVIFWYVPPTEFKTPLWAGWRVAHHVFADKNLSQSEYMPKNWCVICHDYLT